MDKILLLLDHQENTQRLAQKLEPYYHILPSPPPQQQPEWLTSTSGDLVVLDGMALHRLREPLQARRQAEEPSFFPALLVTAQGTKQREWTPVLGQTIDLVVRVPCAPEALRAQIEVLLRARRLSLQLQSANAELEAANALKSQFISIVAHEFRNSLNSIAGFTQLLERTVANQASEKTQALLGRLRCAVHKSEQLTSDLLVLGRTGTSHLQFNPDPLDLAALCRSLIEAAQASDEYQRHVNLTVQGNGAIAVMDATLLEHMLTNLISNALKYSPADSQVQVVVTTEVEQVVIEIQDSGIGIPAADLAQLFQSFHRASNVGQIPGTGLGLAIVQQCVKLHQGEISVKSEVGVGTTFTLHLPLVCSTGS